MSRARVAVLQIVSHQLSVTAAADQYGISRRHLHRLLARYREGGLDALEPRSRRPKTTPIATPETVRARVIELRRQLTADGLDAGPHTIAWHLEREDLNAPAPATISRIVKDAGLVVAQPRSAHAAPTPALKPPSPTRCGNQTSCTTASPTAPTSRFSTG